MSLYHDSLWAFEGFSLLALRLLLTGILVSLCWLYRNGNHRWFFVTLASCWVVRLVLRVPIESGWTPFDPWMHVVDAVLIWGINLTASRVLWDLIRTAPTSSLPLFARAESASQDSTRWRAVLSHLPGLVTLKDLHGYYLFVNNQFTRFCHKPVDQILGKGDEDLFVPEVAEVLEQLEAEGIRTSGFRQEVLPWKSGNRDFLVSRFFLNNGSGWQGALCTFAVDITRLKEKERTLEAAIAQLQRQRSELLSSSVQRSDSDLAKQLAGLEDTLKLLTPTPSTDSEDQPND